VKAQEGQIVKSRAQYRSLSFELNGLAAIAWLVMHLPYHAFPPPTVSSGVVPAYRSLSHMKRVAAEVVSGAVPAHGY